MIKYTQTSVYVPMSVQKWYTTKTIKHNARHTPNTAAAKQHKKLIRRWDRERELSLRQHRTHALQNTIDSCINSATDRRGRVGTQVYTKFIEITQCNGHYVVQGHSKLRLIIGQMFAIGRGECLTLTLSLGAMPANIATNDIFSIKN